MFGSRVEVLQYNFGLGAVTLASLASQASTVVDPLYDGARRSVLVIFAGTNDVALSGTPGATVYSTLASYCNARRAVGWKVCVVTMLPRTGTNTERATYNSLIRANWPSFADALADVGGDATIGQDGQNTNTTYYNADAIHPNSACHAILANYIRAATGKLLLPPARSPLMTGGRLTLSGPDFAAGSPRTQRIEWRQA